MPRQTCRSRNLCYLSDLSDVEGVALEHLAKNPGSEFGKVMFRLLDEYARPEDRALFGFLPSVKRRRPMLPGRTIPKRRSERGVNMARRFASCHARGRCPLALSRSN
jgi:hypothetical protein